MTLSAGVMLVGAATLFESYRRRVSVGHVNKKVDTLSSDQEEIVSNIQQMRKYVEVANTKKDDATQLKAAIKEAPVKATRSKGKSKKISFSDMVSSQSVSNHDTDVVYSDAVTEELILSAIDKASIDVYMQPVVKLPQRRAVMLEVFARLRSGNGQSLTAAQYMRISKAKNLQVKLDNLLLRQSLKALQKDNGRGVNISYMLNIEASTLKDVDFMSEVIGFLKGNTSLSSKIIFEISQSALVDMDKAAISVLKSLSKIGCGVSMDQVEDPHLDRDFLRDIGVKYIKVSCERLKDFSMSDAGVDMMRRIKQNLKEDNVSIISDKIEDERTLCEILDLEIDYGQGYLFGKPDRESVYDSKIRRTA